MEPIVGTCDEDGPQTTDETFREGGKPFRQSFQLIQKGLVVHVTYRCVKLL